MKIPGHWVRRIVPVGIIVCMAAPFGEAAIVRQPQTQQTDNSSVVQPQSANAAGENEKLSGEGSQSNTSPENSNSARTQLDSNAQVGTPPPSPSQEQKNSTSEPVGTAAAPYQKTQGVAASRPAGAVIAPGRQRRARSFLIKVGIIVGAAVAIGTVAALSQASPSRP